MGNQFTVFERVSMNTFWFAGFVIVDQNGNIFRSRLADSRPHRPNHLRNWCRNSLPGCFHLEWTAEKVLRVDSRIFGSSLQGQFYAQCKLLFINLDVYNLSIKSFWFSGTSADAVDGPSSIKSFQSLHFDWSARCWCYDSCRPLRLFDTSTHFVRMECP